MMTTSNEHNNAPAVPTDSDPTSKEQYRRMFVAACEALGAISDSLGCDPEDGGAEPILGAVEELQISLGLSNGILGCLVAKSEAPAEIDVRTILLSIVPGDGNGYEVYAKNVDDVVNRLTMMGEQLEAAEMALANYTATPAGPAVPVSDCAIDEYLGEYMIELDDGFYRPSENDKSMIKDAIIGFLSTIGATAPSQPAVPQGELGTLIHDLGVLAKTTLHATVEGSQRSKERDAVRRAIAILAAAPAPAPAQEQCNACLGTGRMVRDPDIGTDQECFVCDGSGYEPEQEVGLTDEWAECKRISELPEVDEALRLFAEGETSEDQAVAIVQTIAQALRAKGGK